MLCILVFSFLSGFWGNGIGSTAFPLLRTPPGARPSAIGEAFTGAADDVNAIYYNPAGLGQVTDIQIALSHHEWFADIRDENIGLTFPLGAGTIGVNGVFSTARNVEDWHSGMPAPETLTLSSGYLNVAYGINIGNYIALGVAGKGLYDGLPEAVGRGFCFDGGFLYRAGHRLRVGIAFQNLGPGVRYGPERFPLPMGLRLGTYYQFDWQRIGLVGARLFFDANMSGGGTPDLHLGLECPFQNVFALRLGYRLGPQDYRSLSFVSGLTAGLGVALGNFVVDYACVPYGNLGVTQRVSLRMAFNQPQYGRVRIRVTELGSGKPVARAHFTLSGTHAGQSYTESNGVFVIDGVQTGWVKISVEADSFYSQVDSIRVEPRAINSVNFVLTRAGYGSFWGGIYSRPRQCPLAARVVYHGPDSGTTKTTNIEGSFVLRKLRAGFYRIEVLPEDSSYVTLTDTVTIMPGRLVSRTLFLEVKASSSAPNPGGGGEEAPFKH